ncbi:MAG TPA: type VI secretion system baseplate subunit TssG [Blastocatellia bacterium]|nr:type VI secretion system baseplate subunit TssG [Blastocatellia bacterium]
MVAKSWRTDTPLVSVLFNESYRFDFFQAVRLLGLSAGDRAQVGRDAAPSREAVRFRSRVSLQFPPSQIHAIRKASVDGEETAVEMEVAFMGLTGPQGLLPAPYTELLLERVRHRDTTLWEFLDIFNHRLISLFYRAWEKYRFPIAYERGSGDEFTQCLPHTIGIGTRGLRGRLSVPDEALLFYGGLIAQRPHSAASVEAILSDYFGVQVKAAQFSGQWLTLDDEGLTRLGCANSELGKNTIAGSRVWDNQSKYRLELGPLSLKRFTDFVPSGAGYTPAIELTRLLTGQELDFDIQLILRADEVPSLISTSRAKRRPMLGWTSWLKTRPFTRDDSQVVLAAS